MKGCYFVIPLLLSANVIHAKDIQKLSESSLKGDRRSNTLQPPPLPSHMKGKKMESHKSSGDASTRDDFVLITGVPGMNACQPLLRKDVLKQIGAPQSIFEKTEFDVPTARDIGTNEERAFFANIDKLKRAFSFENARCMQADKILSIKTLPNGQKLYDNFFQNLEHTMKISSKPSVDVLQERKDLVLFTSITHDDLCQPLIPKEVLKEMGAPSIIYAHDTYDIGEMMEKGQPYEKKFFMNNLEGLKERMPFDEALCTGFGGKVVRMKDHLKGEEIYHQFFENMENAMNATSEESSVPPPAGPAPDLTEPLKHYRHTR